MLLQPNLEDCNCTMIRKASRRVTRIYDRALALTGLGVNLYSILAKLSRQSMPVSLATLAQAMVMDRSALGHNLRPLEREELAVLGTDPGDRRSRAIALTPGGRERFALAQPHWVNAQERFQAAMGDTGALTLREMLNRALSANYGDVP